MKEEIIKKMYNGELYPAENILPKDKSYWKMIKEEGKKQEHIINMLPTDSDVKEYEELQELTAEIRSMEQYEAFKCGVKIGAGFMNEILEK